MSDRVIGEHALLFDPKDPRCISRTKQSFTKDANINNILAKYIKTGVLSSGVVGSRVASFADVSSGDDYRDVLDKVHAAEVGFMTLSSDVRSKFGNKVANALDFLSDPDNRYEAIELGLIEDDSIVPVVEGEDPDQGHLALEDPATGEAGAVEPVESAEPTGEVSA